MEWLERFEELERTGLLDRLQVIYHIPLVMVIAPVGYGKTTLIHSFLNKKKELDSLWLSLEQGETDDMWIWQKLINKLKLVNTAMYEQVKEIRLPRTEPEIDRFILLLKEILVTPIFVILDDCHKCNSEAIARLITRTVSEDIINLRIIIIGRRYPEIPYEELILKRYCYIVDQYQLTLSKEEEAEIFRINGVDLTEEELSELDRYTDGWISAVYLILLDYKKVGRLRLTSSVLHLLKTFIYDEFPEIIRELFMKMSLFENFSAEMAGYVLEKDIHTMMLDGLIERVGFLKYDPHTERYTMHDLLKDTAAVELDRSGIDKNDLYYRYAEWNEKEGNYIPAIIYYKKSESIGQIFNILERKGRFELFEKAPAVIEDFLDNTDRQLCLNHPLTWLSYIYFLLMEGNEVKGKQLYDEAYCEYSVRDGRDEENRSLMGEMCIIEALMSFNDLDKINGCMKKAYQLLGEKSSRIFDSTMLIMTYGTPDTISLYYSKTGELRSTLAKEKEYARYYMRLIHKIDGGWDGLFDAEYQYITGNIEQAGQVARTLLEKAGFRKQICVTICLYFILLRCDIYQGNRSGFERRMQELKNEMLGAGVHSTLILDYELAAGFVYGLIDRRDKVPEWLQNFRLDQCNYVVRSIRSGCITYGILLRQKKQWNVLEAVAEQMLMPYESSRHIYVYIYAYIYKAIAAYYGAGDAVEAADYLKKSFELAQPDDIRMPYAENSAELLPLLQEVSRSVKYAEQLIPHCNAYLEGLKAFEEKKEEAVLTGREIELMEYVKSGCRNSEIGNMMNIAVVTVEKTLTNIYRKLNVPNRTAAIAKMEELSKG